jgi:hypothetical protein
MSLTRFIKNAVKTEMEVIFGVVAALLVLSTAMMDPYVSAGIAVTLLVALGIYEFVKGHRQDKRYSNG